MKKKKLNSACKRNSKLISNGRYCKYFRMRKKQTIFSTPSPLPSIFTCKYFQPSLMFPSEYRAYLSGAPLNEVTILLTYSDLNANICPYRSVAYISFGICYTHIFNANGLWLRASIMPIVAYSEHITFYIIKHWCHNA